MAENVFFKGHHVELVDTATLLETIRGIHLLHPTANAIQVASTQLKFDKKDAATVKELNESNQFRTVVHGNLMVNLSNSCPIKRASFVKTLQRELVVANEYGADLVIHQGKHLKKMTTQDALDTYVNEVEALCRFMRENGLTNHLLLENAAGQGTEVGCSFGDLAYIWSSLSAEAKPFTGFCIDTCHLFASGELNVSDPELVELWFDRLGIHVGRDNVRLIHLNGSKEGLGSCKDRHAPLTHDSCIDKVGIAAVVKLAKSWGTTVIMETRNFNMDEELEFCNNV